MHLKLLQSHQHDLSNRHFLSFTPVRRNFQTVSTVKLKETPQLILKCHEQMAMALAFLSLAAAGPIKFKPILASPSPLDLTEENINLVLADVKLELAQLFDTSVGITGKAELAELDGPYVKIRLSGRFWHERSVVLARLRNFLKQRIPAVPFALCHCLPVTLAKLQLIYPLRKFWR